MVWLPDGEKTFEDNVYSLIVSTESTSVTDGQTDGHHTTI